MQHAVGADTTQFASANIFPRKDTATVVALNTRPDEGQLTASELWRAVKEDRVIALYHPQVDLATGHTVAVETLARIIDDRGKLIAPGRFIAEAEASGVIVPLGRTVLQKACQALAGWRAAGVGLRRVCVNLSSLQLNLDPTLARFAVRTAETHNLKLADIEFEISEQQLLNADPVASATIDELLDLGGRLAIDDFEGRQRTITTQLEHDVHVVKLDPSIVSRLPDEPMARLLARRAVVLAQDAGLDIVAERVETPGQIEFLRSIGCDRAQGYVYTRPVPGTLVPKFLRFSKLGADVEPGSHSATLGRSRLPAC